MATPEATSKRIAVVTGGNRGIGLEICRQLAEKGITVVLTCRDEKRGVDAVETLKGSVSDGSVVFYRFDVADLGSAASLAEFLKSQFGKLDILVNNAGIIGITVDTERLAKEVAEGNVKWRELSTQTYDLAVKCLETNYYGAKTTTEALLPLLELSASPRIVNVSSSMGKLQNIPNEWAKGILNDAENLTEERIDQVINEFLKDLKEGAFEAKDWPQTAPAYVVSKAAMNGYTRILAKKYPKFRINALCPGYVKTDLNFQTGVLSVEEGGRTPVALAMVPDDGPSGVFFFRDEVSPF